MFVVAQLWAMCFAGAKMKTNASIPPKGLLVVLLVACQGNPCPVGELQGADGNCYRDPLYRESSCATDEPLVGEIRDASMALNSFAYVQLEERGWTIIGFERDKDACAVVEDHVAGTEFWHDGLVVDMSLRGLFSQEGTVEVVESTSEKREDAHMSIRVALTDEWQERSHSGQAEVRLYEPKSRLELSFSGVEFRGGRLEGDAWACYCPDLVDFWEILAPDI